MGMVLGLVSIDGEGLSKVIADPPLIWRVIAPDVPDYYNEARGIKQNTSWFARLFGGGQSEPQPESAPMIEPIEDIDLDKAWHGIHYLLTKTAWAGDPPLDFLVQGGEEIGDIDVGYGTARAFQPQNVKAIRDALAEIYAETLRSRFDPAEMIRLEIYPAIWDREPDDDDTFSYCAEYFDVLKSFVVRAADRNAGIIVYLT
ncbi:MAG: YfbM family protein [Pyrinomonadaceae bacterium]|nr:YfbM family protein [Pyrinomonadaceae bacterium]